MFNCSSVLKNTAKVLCGVMLASVTVPPIASLANTNTADGETINEAEDETAYDPSQNITYTESDLVSAKADLKAYAQYTDSDLAEFSNQEIVYLARELNSPKPRIGVTKIAKAIVKIWKKLPKSVKSKIAKYTSLAGFIKAIDHYTGTEEHVINAACRKVGMSKAWANAVTKTITLFI